MSKLVMTHTGTTPDGEHPYEVWINPEAQRGYVIVYLEERQQYIPLHDTGVAAEPFDASDEADPLIVSFDTIEEARDYLKVVNQVEDSLTDIR